MRSLFAAGALLGLAGCSGPFTAGPSSDAGGESAPIAADASGGAEAGSPSDGGEAEGSTIDAGDAAPACTPFETVGGRAYACTADGSLVGESALPATFAWQFTQTDCGWAPTPAACRCAETYTCACLKAEGACGALGGSWQACDDQDSPAPTVTCAKP